MSSKPNSGFDEHGWIIFIRRTLEEELENDIEIPVSIFSVPRTLMSISPDSYTPQQIAIGPYHYWRSDLYEMDRYKLAAAQRAQKQLQGIQNFDYVVDQLKGLGPQIRACYHKFLDISDETIALMMAIDASFLLEFLQIYVAFRKGNLIAGAFSRSMSRFIDYAGTKTAHNAILRDLLMLENQIPLFVLREMLQVQHSSLESADENLQTMLMGFYEALSPFKMTDMATIDLSECAHLLAYFYDRIVPKAEEKAEKRERKAEITEVEDQGGAIQPKKKDSCDDPSLVKQCFSEIWKPLSNISEGPIRFIKNLLSKLDSPIHLIKKLPQSKPFKLIFRLPWEKLSKLPGFSVFAQPMQYLLIRPKDDKKKSDDDTNKPPLVEEIAIPSVTELAKSKVLFSATAGNISTVSFDTKRAILYLPTISFDVNTEVILRNLVAYEASNASGQLVLTRYTELMNGIIDTEEDVKLLRESGIILNRLKSDAEVANLWNGMSKSIQLTRVPHIDKVIGGVNKYYNNQWKVWKNMKLYVFGSWKVLTLLATIVLLLLMGIQSFCSVYSCRKIPICSDYNCRKFTFMTDFRY